MKVDLAKLENVRTSLEFIFKAEEIELESDEVKLIDDVKFQGELVKHIAQNDLNGEIRTKVELECSRCLNKLESSLEIPFEAKFVSPENYTELKEKELDSEELEVSIIETNEIDLTEFVREQILLAVPAQSFCKEDCKGLCLKCGANKNLIDCKCEEKEIDPRWSALKNFKK